MKRAILDALMETFEKAEYVEKIKGRLQLRINKVLTPIEVKEATDRLMVRTMLRFPVFFKSNGETRSQEIAAHIIKELRNHSNAEYEKIGIMQRKYDRVKVACNEQGTPRRFVKVESSYRLGRGVSFEHTVYTLMRIDSKLTLGCEAGSFFDIPFRESKLDQIEITGHAWEYEQAILLEIKEEDNIEAVVEKGKLYLFNHLIETTDEKFVRAKEARDELNNIAL